MKYKIILLICMIFLLTTISALEFDNVKSYDEKLKTITIKDSFIGIPTTKVAELQLLTPTYNIIYGEGIQRVAEIKITNYENNYENAFKKIDFYYKFGMNDIKNPGFSYKYLTYKNITKDIYGCNSQPGEPCVKTKTGTETIQVEEWLPFNEKTNLPAGEVTIGIYYNDVKEGVVVEWIPTFFGVRIDEWAAFVGSTKYEWYENGWNTYYLSTTSRRGGQTFTPGTVGKNSSFNLTGIAFYGYRVGTPGDITLNVYSLNASGQPDTVLASNSTINADVELDTGYSWVNITFDALNQTYLRNGTKYAWVVELTSVGEIRWVTNGSGGYDGGAYLDDNGVGNLWITGVSDNLFQVWGVEATPPISASTTLSYPANNSGAYIGTMVTGANFSATSGNITNATLYVWWSNGTLYKTNTTTVTGTINTTERTISGLLTGNNYQWNYLGCASNSTSFDCSFATHNRSFSINPMSFGECNTTLNVKFLNFSFKDETTSTALNATISSATFGYYITSEGVSTIQYFSYSNSTENGEYDFCFAPEFASITLNYTFQYAATGYPQRDVSNTNTYTNTTTEILLSLLSSATGIYSTFQVVSPADQPISNVYATAERQVLGIWTLIGSGTTGADGGVTFWVNPNFQHRFNFSKTGYDSASYLITPTQPTYTVVLGGVEGGGNATNYFQGISYRTNPADSPLINETIYIFNFTLSSSYWSLDEFGFVLRNGSGSLIGSNSSTLGTGGTVSLQRTTGANTSISMDYYWIVNGTYTNATRVWLVVEGFDDGWSLKNFFDDLKNYTDEEIFGLNEFSRTLIIFVIIFIIIGTLSYTTGVYSPAAILVELTFLVAFFDFGLELIPNPVNAVPHFPTILISLIMVGFLIMDWKR